MDDFGKLAGRESEARLIARRQWFWLHLAVYLTVQVFLIIVWNLGSTTYPWFIFPLFGWGTLVAAHAVFAFVVRTPEQIMLERETQERELGG
jgi:hypothetical protein